MPNRIKRQLRKTSASNKVTSTPDSKVISYLRVSKNDQETEKNKADILLYANNRKLEPVKFIEEKISGKVHWKKRKIGAIIDELGKGDHLILPELSRSGKSMLEIMEILSVATENGITVYDVKNGWILDGSLQSKILAMAFGISAEIERDLISKRTIEGLKAARAKGKLLGRPKGPGKSKLDDYREEIEALLKTGVPKTKVAKKYNASVQNLYNWLKQNDIQVEATV